MSRPYPYDERLPDPLSFGNIDFEKGFGKIFFRAYRSFVTKQARKFVCPQGIIESRGTYPSYDDAKIPYHFFEPENCTDNTPIMIYYHGGAFLFGIQLGMLEMAANYAKELGIRVLLPDYRIAPENSCRTVLEDSYAALLFAVNNAKKLNILPEKLMVYGDSAGGALAAATALMARDRKGPSITAQLLMYPVIDSRSNLYGSIDEYPMAPWSRTANQHMWSMYMSHGDCGMMQYAAPILSDLHDLPQTYLEPQEMDILRDEALAYGEKLQAAGVPTEINVISGSYHGADMRLDNPYIQEILQHRYKVIRQFLK